jgi:hypothetical protein
LLAALLSSCATSANRPTADSRDHPLGTGSVEFIGLRPADLQDLRVIPEEGAALFVPSAGQRIEDVDGFWWRNSRQWFKIPDHCHATITKTADGGLLSQPACGKLGTSLQRLSGGAASPGWQTDSGATAHGTDYPF